MKDKINHLDKGKLNNSLKEELKTIYSNIENGTINNFEEITNSLKLLINNVDVEKEDQNIKLSIKRKKFQKKIGTVLFCGVIGFMGMSQNTNLLSNINTNNKLITANVLESKSIPYSKELEDTKIENSNTGINVNDISIDKKKEIDQIKEKLILKNIEEKSFKIIDVFKNNYNISNYKNGNFSKNEINNNINNINRDFNDLLDKIETKNKEGKLTNDQYLEIKNTLLKNQTDFNLYKETLNTDIKKHLDGLLGKEGFKNIKSKLFSSPLEKDFFLTRIVDGENNTDQNILVIENYNTGILQSLFQCNINDLKENINIKVKSIKEINDYKGKFLNKIITNEFSNVFLNLDKNLNDFETKQKREDFGYNVMKKLNYNSGKCDLKNLGDQNMKNALIPILDELKIEY